MTGRLSDLLSRTVANGAEFSRLHQARPAGVSPHLLGAELVACGREEFNRDTPSITQDLTTAGLEQLRDDGLAAAATARLLDFDAAA